MLSILELKNYISLRGLSIRDIEAYCKLSAGHISNILNGERPLTEENHKQITDAINLAYFAKKNGTFKRPKLDENRNAVKNENDSVESTKQSGIKNNRKRKQNN